MCVREAATQAFSDPEGLLMELQLKLFTKRVYIMWPFFSLITAIRSYVKTVEAFLSSAQPLHTASVPLVCAAQLSLCTLPQSLWCVCAARVKPPLPSRILSGSSDVSALFLEGATVLFVGKTLDRKRYISPFFFLFLLLLPCPLLPSALLSYVSFFSP